MGRTDAGDGAAHAQEAYCRGCDYWLRGLAPQGKCPECGRNFDLADPRTYRPCPRPRLWRLIPWRAVRRTAYGLLVLALLAAAPVGWAYWGWRSERPAIRWVQKQGGDIKMRLVGPPWVHERAGGYAWLLARADVARVRVGTLQAGQERVLGQLTRLREVSLVGSGVTDESLEAVAEMTELEWAVLWGSRVTDAGVERLQHLRKLRVLFLDATAVQGPGLVYLARLPRLEALWLNDTSVDDEAVRTLVTMTGLTELNVRRTKLTQTGVTRLRQALPKTFILTDPAPGGLRPTNAGSDFP